jgi:aquaporin Z
MATVAATREAVLGWVQILRAHWPEYLIEGWALGLFMVSAGVVTTLFEYPGSPLRAALPDPDIRRILIGICMGLTAVGLIYSPWGQRSGAHMNPAVTLTFWRLGKVKGMDALFYMVSQFLGGTLGVWLVILALGNAFTQSPVLYAATVPGPGGVAVAFVAELAISFGMMLMVLIAINTPRLAKRTGLFAGALVATWISIEAPLSGMSMNPARTFASAAPGALWADIWLYFSAPVLGMLAAATAYCAWRGRSSVGCAKLLHPMHVRCIHCGHEPASGARS